MTKEPEKPEKRKVNGVEDDDESKAAASGKTVGSSSGGSSRPAGADDEDEDEEDEEDEDEDEDEDEEDEDEEEASAKSPASSAPEKRSEPSAARSVPAPAGHAPAPAGHAHAVAHDHEHGLAHVTPVSLLAGVLGALLVLTVITVYTAGIDLGAQYNLILALVIATVKAGLVVTYFMHLRWDKKLHALVFLSSVLFLILFLSMSLTDRREYQRSIDEVDQKAAQGQ